MRENLIRQLLHLSQNKAHTAVPADQLARALALSRGGLIWCLASLKRHGLVEQSAQSPASVALTDLGLARALRLDRAHRLWETFLVDQVGLASDHVHPSAELVEHLLSDQLVERVDDALGHPPVDPHGQPIPRSPINDQQPRIYSLSNLRPGDKARVAGFVTEAASDAAFETPSTGGQASAGATALGLLPGAELVLCDRRIGETVWTVSLPDGRTIDVPHELADLILVELAPAGDH